MFLIYVFKSKKLSVTVTLRLKSACLSRIVAVEDELHFKFNLNSFCCL